MIEATNLLAKLLAKENITIVHSNGISKAVFNINTRILSLPIYKEMEGDIYDGMMAVEVARALWTPPSLFKSASDKIGTISPDYVQILEMVEQVRTTNNMKIEYPGLTSTFSKMYLEFWDRDYFGIRGQDLDELNIVDKLNLNAKMPWLPIKFEPIEQTFKDDLAKVADFKTACVVSRDIIEYLEAQKAKNASAPAPSNEEHDKEDDKEEQDDSDDGQSTKSEDDQTEEPDEDEDEDGDENEESDEDSELDDETDDETDEESESESDDETDEESECESDSETDEESESESDEESESESDEESESESDDESDADSESESDDESDADSESESDDKSDADSESESDDESDADSESESDDKSDADSESESDDKSDADSESESDEESDDETDADSESDLDASQCNQMIQSICNLEDSLTSDDIVDLSAEEVQTIMVRNILNPMCFVDKAEVVHTQWNGRIRDDNQSQIDYVNAEWLKFQQTEAKTIEIMKQSFDLRKNAAELRRVRTAKSGRLDLKKLAFYKISEDIFKSTSKVDDGQNHGVALLVDFSGSMTDNLRMVNTLKQALVMVLFCQSVNIPFVVYGFTNRLPYNYSMLKGKEFGKPKYANESHMNSIVPDQCVLRELINSELPNITQRQIMRNIFREAISNNPRTRRGVLPCESLGGTPTVECMSIASQAIAKFKEDMNIQVMNTMLMTDGVATLPHTKNGLRGGITFIYDELTRKNYSSVDFSLGRAENHASLLPRMMGQILKDRVGSSMITVYSGTNSFLRTATRLHATTDEMMSLVDGITKNGFAALNDSKGNDVVLFSVDHDIDFDMKLNTDGKTLNNIKNQFIEQSKKQLQTKIFADTLLTVIAKKMDSDEI